MQTTDNLETDMRQGGIAACMEPIGMLLIPQWVWWGPWLQVPPAVAFCSQLFLGSERWDLMVKGLRWRWTDAAHVVSGRFSTGILGVQCQMGCAHPRIVLLMSRVTHVSKYQMPIPTKRAEHSQRPSVGTVGISRRFRRRSYASI